MNDHHNSNTGPELPYISTQDMATATDYLDQIIEAVRETHNAGGDLDVEKLTMLMLTAFCEADTSDRSFIAQQALILSIAVQRLAA